MFLGIRQAAILLKEKYLKELLTWMLVGCDGITCDVVSREKAFVNLAIIEAQLMDKDWNDGDRDFHMKTKHFERTSITLEEILSREDDFVVVRGIAGIGKTSMVDSYVLKWAKHELLNGNENNPLQIDFLFKLTCRNINTFTNISTAEQLLRTEYGNVLKDVEFEDLEDISHRILILLDGADELQSLHQISNAETRPLSGQIKSVYDLIDIRSNFLTGHKTIIVARPEACQIIDATFKSVVIIKMIEICGFNPRSVCVYVDNYFGKNIITAQIVKQKIEESENLTVMASIPVFTWVICAVFNEDINIESPRTTTHLCTYACLLFIRNHLKQTFRNLFPSNCSLLEVINNTNVVKVILSLAKLSKSTLKHKKVVFFDTDLSSVKSPIAIESTGFIEKNQRKNIYQFRHMVLQEYLAALYLYLKSSNLTKVFHENNYRSCIPIIAAFSGIENAENTEPIAFFINKLREYTSMGKWKMVLPRSPAKRIVLNWLTSMIRNLVVQHKLILDENCSLLLAAFYEYQGDIPGNLVDILMHTPIVFKNIMFHHDIRNALYFFSKLRATNISEIDITNFTKKKFPLNMVDMLKLYFSKKENNILCLRGGNAMKIYSDLIEENVNIQFAWDDNNLDTHDEFLLAAIRLADTIILHYSLDNTYPHVRNLLKANDVKKVVKYKDDIEFNNKPNHLKMFSDAILIDRKKRDEDNIKLNLSYCFLTDEHIESLKPCIPYLENLIIAVNKKMSYLSMKCTSDAVMEAIKINNTSNLKLIDLSWCNLTDEHIVSLQPCIPYLENLILKGNEKMSSQSMKSISDAVMEAIKITTTSNLKLIDLSQCNLTDEHIESLQGCIPYMENLIMKGNEKMSSHSMRFISDAVMEAIKINNTSNLKLIDLSQCNLTDDHIESLQGCIPYLENLIMSVNKDMSSKSMRFISDAVMEAIKINNTSNLKLLDLARCNLTDEHIESLQACIPYLENLIMKGNEKMSYQSMRFISDAVMEAIKINKTCNLKLIDLSWCNLTDEHIESLEACIPYLEKLITIGNEKYHIFSFRIYRREPYYIVRLV